ncbi:hypothetical protein JXC34_07335 [Candidatus Woesearchaeota archaeon]|nr:hypothetical protein [Candidatus Woesearchaeota archaeon]
MEPKEEQDLEKLLSKDYIERKGGRKIIIGKDGQAKVLSEWQKVTGIDASGVITEADIEKKGSYECSHPVIVDKTINIGGQCVICGKFYCNGKENGQSTCSRRCIYCHRYFCKTHVRGEPGDDAYCSIRCRILRRLRRGLSLRSITPLFLILAVLIIFVILFNLVR